MENIAQQNFHYLTIMEIKDFFISCESFEAKIWLLAVGVISFWFGETIGFSSVAVA